MRCALYSLAMIIVRRKSMKKILLSCMCIITTIFAEVTAAPAPRPIIEPPIPTNPIVRPPLRPINPIDRPILVREDYNYYTNPVSSCDEYIRIIEKKNGEIDRLKKEIESLKSKEHAKLQKNLRTEYEQELKKFDERKSGIKTKNSIDVSDK